MADATVTCSYVDIQLDMADDGRLRISAKQSFNDRTKYLAGDLAKLEVFEEVLSKLAIALNGEKKPIQLKVRGGSIVRDDSFKLPACGPPGAAVKVGALAATAPVTEPANVPEAKERGGAGGASAVPKPPKKKAARRKPRRQ